MKNWKVIKTESDYKIALQRTINIFDANNDAALSDELDLLLVLIMNYEKKNIHLPAVSSIEVVKLKMEEQGMKAKDLVPIIGSKGHVSSILSGRRELTLKMAQRLKTYFQLSAEVFLSV